MLDALIGGALVGAPLEKTSAGGRVYVTCRLRVAIPEGEAIFVQCTAFATEPKRQLLAHASGDSIAIAGPVKLGIWQPEQGEPRINASVVVNEVLSAYAVRQRRAAVQRETEAPTPGNSNRTRDGNGGLDGLDRMHGGERRARQERRTTPALANDSLDDL